MPQFPADSADPANPADPAEPSGPADSQAAGCSSACGGRRGKLCHWWGRGCRWVGPPALQSEAVAVDAVGAGDAVEVAAAAAAGDDDEKGLQAALGAGWRGCSGRGPWSGSAGW